MVIQMTNHVRCVNQQDQDNSIKLIQNIKAYKFLIALFSILILSCTSKNIKEANQIISKIENKSATLSQ